MGQLLEAQVVDELLNEAVLGAELLGNLRQRRIHRGAHEGLHHPVDARDPCGRTGEVVGEIQVQQVVRDVRGDLGSVPGAVEPVCAVGAARFGGRILRSGGGEARTGLDRLDREMGASGLPRPRPR